MSDSKDPSARILAIDDDEEILSAYEAIIESQGMLFEGAQTIETGLKLAASRPFDVCLLDRSIGYQQGMEALPELLSQAPSMRVIMCTAHRDTEAALEALSSGVHDYLVKPFSPEQLRIALARQIEARRLATRVQTLEREVKPGGRLQPTSRAEPMQRALAMAKQVARTNANVLVLGESGTGKNVVARAIHAWSQRSGGSCVIVNCPSLNAELLENELFGHRKGAFTGAQHSSEGRVAQADAGTLFLDEIGDFPLALQPKLLRFIQDKEYERVGDPVTRKADVRLVTATNRNLEQMAEEGSFRQDLFYRLNVVAITLPPLRERREDVVDLASGFVTRFAKEYGCPARRLDAEAEALLLDYPWPGNVRELQNVIERAVILCPDESIPASALVLSTSQRSPGKIEDSGLVGSSMTLERLERKHIEATLARTDTLDEAARQLGIDASTLYRKRKAYGLI